MKKITAVILILVYFVSTTGATVNLHYCMDQLIEQNLFRKNSEEACSNCGMSGQKKKDCCNDEQKQVKIESDHYASELCFQYSKFVSPVPEFNLFPFSNSFASVTGRIPRSNAPPLETGVPLYKLICTFRI